jgi:uncharacterized protein YkwD
LNRLIKILLIFISATVLWPSSEFLKHSFTSDCRAEESTIRQTVEELKSGHSQEQELFALINKERGENNLPPLLIDDSLMRLAREHSEEMAKQAIISHDQPSGDLQIRMHRVGYLFEAARENIAWTKSFSRVHSDFLKSETHKGNILAKDVTHIGIGIVRQPDPGDKYLAITEIFAAPRESHQPSAIHDILVNQIKNLQHKGAVMNPDPMLDKIASRSLVSLQVPYNREELKTLLSKSANELMKPGNPSLSKLEIVVQLLRNPQDVAFPSSSHHGQNLMYGSAVRQINDSRNQPAFLVLTLISVSR